MKKYVFLTAAAFILSLALAGCTGGADKDSTDAPANTPTAADTETSPETDVTTSKYDENFTDADKDVDMGAIEGKTATSADDSNADGEVNGTGVKIVDAKVVEFGEGNAIIVSFDFTNNTESDATFNGLLRTDADQDGTYLTAATTLSMDGYVPETLVQTVKSGETITVQRAYKLYDDTTPVTITVENVADSYDKAKVEKTFNIE